MKRRNILIILIIGALGLFWDDIATRVSRLENYVRGYAFFGQRITNLEEEINRTTVLEKQMLEVENELKRISPLSAKLNLTTNRLNIIEDFMMKTALEGKVGRVFRTTQVSDQISDSSIGSNPSHRNGNWGGHTFVWVGGADADYTARILIKFEELTPMLMKGKKIEAAVIYLKQTQPDDLVEDDQALNETINVFRVRKKWNQGTHIRGQADQGEVTWVSARTGQEQWAVPGASDEKEDFDPLILATSGPVLTGNAQEWVPLTFTSAGLIQLQDMLSHGSVKNQGFILRNPDENQPNAFLFFHSSESSPQNRPYIEIYYTEEPTDQLKK
ncbi:MAG: DNRLRE domain-containing protein [Candidatus Omnitrophica bacterium]|nr:DNRLRE domain-containing protein [Candidatus Omnitrophota bacterium]